MVPRLPHLPRTAQPRLAGGNEYAARRHRPMNSQQLGGLMQAAAQALGARDDLAAEGALRQIVSVDPRHADAWHMLAALILRAGRSAEAVECAQRAHELDRRNPLYLNTLGIAHGEAGQLDEAVRCFKRSLKERPSRADTHFNLGKTYVKLGDLSEAERCLVRARTLDSERAEIVNGLVALYSQQGRYQDALPILAQARARMPDHESLAVYSAGVALAASGPDAAIQELERFVQRHPDSAAAREALALRFLAEGRFAEGWQQYAWRSGRPSAQRAGELQGRRVLLLHEQGLGDHLFFLRFARRLRQLAAFIGFDCPAK